MFSRDIIISTKYINLIFFSLLPIAGFFLGKSVYNIYAGYICAFFMAIYPLNWEWGMALMTEMPYIFLSFISLLFMILYIKNPNMRNLLLCSFVIFLSMMTRFVGLGLFLAFLLFFIIILYFGKVKKIYHLLVFTALMSVPVFFYYYKFYLFENHTGVTYGITNGNPITLAHIVSLINDITIYFINPYHPYPISILNMNFSFISILYLILFALFLIILVYVMGIIIFKIKKDGISVIIRSQLEKIPILLYLVMYIIFVELLYSYPNGMSPTRHLVPIMPLLLILVIVILLKIITYFSGNKIHAIGRTFCIFALFFLAGLYVAGSFVYYTDNHAGGFGFSAQYWEQNQGLIWIRDNNINGTILTNMLPGATYFYIHDNPHIFFQPTGQSLSEYGNVLKPECDSEGCNIPLNRIKEGEFVLLTKISGESGMDYKLLLNQIEKEPTFQLKEDFSDSLIYQKMGSLKQT